MGGGSRPAATCYIPNFVRKIVRRGLVDETFEILQAARPMRRLSLLFLSLILLTKAGHGQIESSPGSAGITNSSASIDTNLIRQITLDECIQLAVEKNLDVRIARFGPEIARFNLEAAYGAYDPAFRASYIRGYNLSPGGIIPGSNLQFGGSKTHSDTFQVGFGGILPSGMTYDLGSSQSQQDVRQNGIPVTPFQYQGNERLSLRQPLLRNFWIDGTRLTIAINRKDLQISQNALMLQLMSIITSTRQAYYDLIFARENVKVQEKALELADRLLFENRQRVKAGALAPLDEEQATSQAAVSRSDVLTARRLQDVQENLLKRLLSDDFSQWVGLTVVPAESLTAVREPVNLTDSWFKGMTLRPELLQQKLELEKYDLQLKYNRNQLFPVLDLIGTYGHNSRELGYRDSFNALRDREAPFYTIGAEVSVPFSNKEFRNRYRATRAAKQQALLRLKQIEQDVMIQIDDAVKLVKTSYERVEATRQARIYALSAMEAEQKKLLSGKSTSFVVLQLQRDMTARNSEEIRALADYNNALANLSLVEGTTLERNGVRLEVR